MTIVTAAFALIMLAVGLLIYVWVERDVPKTRSQIVFEILLLLIGLAGTFVFLFI